MVPSSTLISGTHRDSPTCQRARALIIVYNVVSFACRRKSTLERWALDGALGNVHSNSGENPDTIHIGPFVLA